MPPILAAALAGLLLAGFSIAASPGLRGPAGVAAEGTPAGVATAAPTPRERLVPTAAPAGSADRPGPAAVTPAATEPVRVPPVNPGLWAPHERFGLGVPEPPVDRYPVSRLGIGWYYAWRVLEAPPAVTGVEAWQMVRVAEDGYRPDAATIIRVAQRYPGSVWLIGNEPDVIWQDNTTPAGYARAYHAVYHLLKQADPACQVAAGGITQPSPLRLQYLDAVRYAYRAAHGEPLPADLWHIHNFILREERGSWGVDIPPGVDADRGRLYEVQDSDGLTAFRQQLVDFRRWMRDHGERDKPLVVSEFGIPMPADYGFDDERVRAFMTAAFDFMLTATDAELGYPADGNRLVQRWAWFSMGDTLYPTGNMADLETGQLTALGVAFGDYVGQLR